MTPPRSFRTEPAATSTWATRLIRSVNGYFGRIPDSLIAALGRFSIAAVFWKSGQTKIEGFALDIVDGTFQFGMPHLSDSALMLFREEYRLPFVSPELAAPLTTLAEHLFPALLLIGLATRLSATALFLMTLMIEIFVYPSAYPTHGVWATVLLYLMAQGGGTFSIDHWIALKAQPARTDTN